MSICPIRFAAQGIAEAIGYSADSAYDLRRLDGAVCDREECALWTRYGCGLSHNVTVHAPEEETSDA